MTPCQKHTSAKTCRAQVPALHRALLRAHVWSFYDTNADIGGGKYDHATRALEEAYVGNVVYDPYNRAPSHNRTALKVIKSGLTTATVANVLNCILEPEFRAEVIKLAAESVAPCRTAYFAVYEGDRSGEGQQTRDGWQENRKLATYVSEVEAYFENVSIVVVEGLRCIVAYGSRLV